MWLHLWLAAFAAEPTPGPSTDEAKALYVQGVSYYERGDYSTAIRLWRKSYEITGEPAILFNIAKAHEEDGNPRAALAAWREYQPLASPDDQRLAATRIRELELVVSALGEPEPAPAPSASPPPPAPAPAPAPASEPTPAVSERKSYRGLAVAGLALGGAGAVTAGTWLSVSARSAAGDTALAGCVTLDGAALCDGPSAASLRADRTLFGVGLGIVGGGALFGVGSVALALAPRQDDSVAIGLGPNGLVIAGRM